MEKKMTENDLCLEQILMTRADLLSELIVTCAKLEAQIQQLKLARRQAFASGYACGMDHPPGERFEAAEAEAWASESAALERELGAQLGRKPATNEASDA